MANDDGKDEIGVPAGTRGRLKSVSESEPDPDSDSDVDEERSGNSKYGKNRSRTKRRKTGSLGSNRRQSRDSDSYSSSSSEYDSDSVNSKSSSEDSEEEERRRRKKEKKRREEKKEKRRKEKERHRKRKDREEKRKRDKKKEKKKNKDKENKGAVTGSWGKYGILRETDMWNKRPEFTAWLAEVKHVNLESLPNWEEKQLFKDFMEDHNTATFPSKKYYNLDAYYQHKMEKERRKGHGKVAEMERTVFDDEEQRRLELRRERERQKEEQVEALKRSMQGGMAQAMKEQAQLREEMAYLYKIGKMEAAAAIQRRLDPDVAM